MSTNPLVRALLNMSTSGDLVVLTLLVFLSIWATAIIIERFFYFRKVLSEVLDSVNEIRSSLASAHGRSGVRPLEIGMRWLPPNSTPSIPLLLTRVKRPARLLRGGVWP